MRRFLIIVVAVLSLLLEVAFFSNIKIFGVTPNVFLMFIIASSFIIPEEDLMLITLLGALFLDLFAPSIFGLETMAILLIIFFMMLASYYVFSSFNFVLLAILAASSTFAFDMLYAGALTISGLKVDIIFFLKHFVASKIIVNTIFVLVFYAFLSSLWDRLLKTESRARFLR